MNHMFRSALSAVRYSKKGSSGAWIAVAIIVAVAIIAATVIYTQNQTHPFWEVQ